MIDRGAGGGNGDFERAAMCMCIYDVVKNWEERMYSYRRYVVESYVVESYYRYKMKKKEITRCRPEDYLYTQNLP